MSNGILLDAKGDKITAHPELLTVRQLKAQLTRNGILLPPIEQPKDVRDLISDSISSIHFVHGPTCSQNMGPLFFFPRS